MTKAIFGSLGVFAIALLSPGTSQAGKPASVSFEGFVERYSMPGGNGAGGVECATENQCQIPDPTDPTFHQPVIRFVLDTPQIVHVVAGFWSNFDCPDTETPDTIEGNVDFSGLDPSLLPAQVGIRINFAPPQPPDGTTFAMEWIIGPALPADQCPVSACHNYTLGDADNMCM